MKETGFPAYQHEVKATLDGKKTQTRRVIKPQPDDLDGNKDIQGVMARQLCPYGQVGDRLWVRESFSLPERLCNQPVWYWADGPVTHGDWTKPKPSIHMPRWASRITLEITGVKVHRIQEMDELDALNEGTPESYWRTIDGPMETSAGRIEGPFLDGTAVEAFSRLWDSINAKRGYGWESNPWVWAVTFRKVEWPALD